MQWLFAVVYSALFPVFVSFGGAIATIAIFLYIPFLPVGWIGGSAFVCVFKTQNAYPAGLSITILLQVIFVMMNLKYYFKQNTSNAKKLMKRIAFLLVFLLVGVVVIYHA